MKTSLNKQQQQLPKLQEELGIQNNQIKRSIWEVVADIGSQIPDKEWEKVPRDASINYKHYLYDSPKKDR